MTISSRVKLLAFLSLFLPLVASETNFTQCLANFKAGGNVTGGTDWFGRPVNDPNDAVALTYEECKSLCGTGQESFDWSVFSQQFSAWLLPWLALVSQLPFGAESRLDNLISGKPPSLLKCSLPQILITFYTSRSHRRLSYPGRVLTRTHGS
jgi:hypothetical protein